MAELALPYLERFFAVNNVLIYFVFPVLSGLTIFFLARLYTKKNERVVQTRSILEELRKLLDETKNSVATYGSKMGDMVHQANYQISRSGTLPCINESGGPFPPNQIAQARNQIKDFLTKYPYVLALKKEMSELESIYNSLYELYTKLCEFNRCWRGSTPMPQLEEENKSEFSEEFPKIQSLAEQVESNIGRLQDKISKSLCVKKWWKPR